MILINPRNIESSTSTESIYFYEMTGAVGCAVPETEHVAAVTPESISSRELNLSSLELQKAV
jgi:hypothetical protein